jgi:Protein of unknown function (DUF1706)
MRMEINPNTPVTKANCLHFIEMAWGELQRYLATLSAAQMSEPQDAAGWAVKDHVAHLAAWQNGIAALLEGKSRPEAMGISAEVWANHADYDALNAIIFEAARGDTPAQAMQQLQATYARLVNAITALPVDAALMKPYREYDPTSDQERPIIEYIMGNTAGHYEEHLPWMQAIVAGG